MASSQPPSKPDSLAFMTKLSHAVYLSRPTSQQPTHSPQPNLILILGWVEARNNHLSHYVRAYRALYPNATILLVKSRLAIMAFASLAPGDVSPALPAIRSALEAQTSTEPAKANLHIHLFSNGGSCLLSELRKAYRANAPAGSDPRLPLHTTIFDSTPSTHFSRTIIAASILASLPKNPLSPLFYLITHFCTFIFWLQIYLPGYGGDPYKRRAADHNDVRNVREERRVYVYSDVDPLVPCEQVEHHAAEAEKRGFVVRREMFKGSPHVAHAKSEGERYWGVVREVLGGRA